MTLLQAEDRLQQLLGDSYIDSDWPSILKIVMDAKRDVGKALEGLDKRAATIFGPPITENTSTTRKPAVSPLSSHQQSFAQLAEAECELLKAVNDLKHQKRIIGSPLTLEDMLNPFEEKEIGDSLYRFHGGEDSIVAQVNYEMAVKRGEIVEEDDEDDEDDTPDFTVSEMINICETMEKLTLAYGNPESRLSISQGLRRFQIDLWKMQDKTVMQATLDRWFES